MSKVAGLLPWRRPASLAEITDGPEHAAKIGYLSAIEIFADLPDQRLRWIKETTTMFTCSRGAVIYEPGETGEVLFLLKRGLVQLYELSPAGKKLVVGTLAPGAFFGDMPLLGQAMCDTFAEAARECLICAMGQGDVEALLLAEPSVALRILHVIGGRLHEQRTVLADVVFKSVPGRVAALLLRTMAETGNETIAGFSQQDLADRAGVARETMTQTLNEFASMGAVELHRMTVILRDRELLEALAAR
ncbi:MAG: Crp/Fnr family transcriptional regulator [Chloroflexota bacterium]